MRTMSYLERGDCVQGFACAFHVLYRSDQDDAQVGDNLGHFYLPFQGMESDDLLSWTWHCLCAGVSCSR